MASVASSSNLPDAIVQEDESKDEEDELWFAVRFLLLSSSCSSVIAPIVIPIFLLKRTQVEFSDSHQRRGDIG